MIISIVFKKLKDLDAAVGVLARHLDEDLHCFLEWFEDNNTDRINRNGQRKRLSRFHLEAYTYVLNFQNKTNNHAEAVYRKLHIEMGCMQFVNSIFQKKSLASLSRQWRVLSTTSWW